MEKEKTPMCESIGHQLFGAAAQKKNISKDCPHHFWFVTHLTNLNVKGADGRIPEEGKQFHLRAGSKNENRSDVNPY